MTKAEQRKAEVEARKAAKRAKWAAAWNRPAAFAPATPAAEIFSAPLPTAEQAFRDKVNGK